MCANDRTAKRYAEWHKAQAEPAMALFDGDQILIAQEVCTPQYRLKTRWAYEVLVIDCDEDYFEFRTPDGELWDGCWSDVDYWILVSEFRLQSLALTNEVERDGHTT